MSLAEAVEKAIDDCIRNGILADFLSKIGQEEGCDTLAELLQSYINVHENQKYPVAQTYPLTLWLLHS